MKTRILFLFFALILAAGSSLSAQTTKADRAKQRAENRANRKVDNKVDRTVDTAVDDAFNAIGGLFKKKDKKAKQENASGGAEEGGTSTDGDAANTTSEEDAAANDLMSSLFGGGDWEPYTNPRAFSMNWEMTTTKNNGKTDNINMSIATIENQSGVHMTSTNEPDQSTRMILDTQTGKTTMITTDKEETTAYRLRMPNMKKAIAKEMDNQMEEGRWTIEATGERMIIDGYNCEKYVVTDTKTNDVTTSWVTKDLDLTMEDVSLGMAGAFGGGQAQNPASGMKGDAYEGVMIKATTVTKKETHNIHLTNIKIDGATDKTIFDVSGIEIIDTGF